MLNRFWLVLSCALVAASAPLAAATASQSGRPNVVVFITDDESWLERSIYGWSNLPTPNFDRVADVR